MNLLVTQLQHQDPTQPQDDSQFIAQLAQFSSLDQLTQMNTTLSQIASFFLQVQSGGASTGATTDGTTSSNTSNTSNPTPTEGTV